MKESTQSTRRVVLAVTSHQSLKLMKGFPEYLGSRSYDVHVVADGPLEESGLPEGCSYHPLAMTREPSPLRDMQALISWVLLLRRLRPDAVIAGTPKAGLLGMIAARVLRVPVRIYHLRGLRLETVTGMRLRVLSLLERVAAASATSVLCVSHSLRTEFLARSLARPEKVVVLGLGSSNGVDLDRFDRFAETGVVDELAASLEVRGDSPVVGFVGRLTADKGIETLFQALARLRRQGVPARLLILGREDRPGALAELTADVSLDEGSVIHAGYVVEPAPYYRLMDVLCLPTRREGFPNVVLEAAASGVPAVAAAVTGCVDAVDDGKTGLLFKVDNCGSLARQLNSVLTDQTLRQELGQSALERARRHFSRGDVWELTADFIADQIQLMGEETSIR